MPAEGEEGWERTQVREMRKCEPMSQRNPASPPVPRPTFSAHLRPEMSCDSDRDSGQRVVVYSVRVAQMCRTGERCLVHSTAQVRTLFMKMSQSNISRCHCLYIFHIGIQPDCGNLIRISSPLRRKNNLCRQLLHKKPKTATTGHVRTCIPLPPTPKVEKLLSPSLEETRIIGWDRAWFFKKERKKTQSPNLETPVLSKPPSVKHKN